MDLDCMNPRINKIASVPNSTASCPSIDFPVNLSGGKWCRSFCSVPDDAWSTMSRISWTLSSEFIFMKGHVAHPPAVEQPSPPATPGTNGISSSPPSPLLLESVAMTASLLTGKTISASTTFAAAAFACAKTSLTFLTIDETIPASVPNTNRSLRGPSLPPSPPSLVPLLLLTASWTFRVMNVKISDVDPTTPLSWRDKFIAISNISPGTSRWAVTKVSCPV
mmetsp:Transcript_28128/g.68390  ORF Transcript_28128/g.68390 Transcript_28128/m.68390 type:complete len:222 (+) Transcript_28128:794-1459(+)